MEDALEAAPLPPPDTTSHLVVIVDHSGSMRKEDVPGYPTRTAAVYDCLARDLVEPQVKLDGLGRMEMSLIEMNDVATVILERSAPDETLLNYIRSCSTRRAHSHGNYLPALDAALGLLKGDATRGNRLFLIFLSDGAPSDHTDMQCAHGYSVWQPDARGTFMRNGKPRLQDCPVSKTCREAVRESVKDECVSYVKHIGDLLGRDRVYFGSVAFGPPTEDYTVLQGMARALPRSSFQKLGLSLDCLRTALTSLSSTLTSLRTEAVGSRSRLTLRTDLTETAQRQSYEERTLLRDGGGWDIYVGKRCISKLKYDVMGSCYVKCSIAGSDLASELGQLHPRKVQRGIAHAAYKFAEGAERVVFQCTEVVSVDGGATGYSVGPRLVAKETRYTEHLRSKAYYPTLCRLQGEAEELAQLFNRRLRGGSECQVRFLPCYVFTLRDPRYPTGKGEIVVEEELEGVYTKWNDNAGRVAQSSTTTACADSKALGAIVEDDEEEEDREVSSVPIGDVPQCFSHFTYEVTFGRKLVCDLQASLKGVWNAMDGFTLTDPVIHHHSGLKKNGDTDKGMAGIREFFATHNCGPLCKRLGMEAPVF
ncbi:hypothetical protein GPECTOR_56g358 [Gonium pectorale]|uniref:Alpha-type protein kinase domain-containing protein n=1 Tax=Gonium pectorale TaxID=33097 RepID=A0A150G5Y6_GONPE|nr:hypothetical protein GPECTOR_56g358 [Gonium pectorale]|eukprot:KXZ45262.1 hypothetical protein GPECTOR_56g358 [Gonium pectorale]